MDKLPKWFLTSGLPAFRDGESSTALEQTYKVYQAMQNLIDEYNKFVDTYNTEWSQFEEKYNGDMEVFTTSLRQEFQDFIDVVDLKVSGIDVLEQEINNIKTILQSNDVNYDELQELVNGVKGNITAIDQVYAELNKKADVSYVDQAIANAGGSGGSKLYKHILNLTLWDDIEDLNSYNTATLVLITNYSEPITDDNMHEKLLEYYGEAQITLLHIESAYYGYNAYMHLSNTGQYYDEKMTFVFNMTYISDDSKSTSKLNISVLNDNSVRKKLTYDGDELTITENFVTDVVTEL